MKIRTYDHEDNRPVLFTLKAVGNCNIELFGGLVHRIENGSLLSVVEVNPKSRDCLVQFRGIKRWIPRGFVDEHFVVNSELTTDNIDAADFLDSVDAVETLRRIGKEWLALRQSCTCVGTAACSICEITYLLNEAFEVKR